MDRFRSSVIFGIILAGAALPGQGATSVFNADAKSWTISNTWIRAEFQFTDAGNFRTVKVADLRNKDEWVTLESQPSSVVRFQVEDTWFDATMPFELVDHYTEKASPDGIRQVVVLRDVFRRGLVTVNLEVYDGHPVMRYSVKFKNLTPAQVHVKFGNMLPFAFGDRAKKFTALRVNQWSLLGKPTDFEPVSSAVDTSGRMTEVYSGAHGEQCGWISVRDTDGRTISAGWEFDGRARITVKHSAPEGYLQFAGNIVDLYHPVAPDEEFQIPAAFVVLTRGDFDESAYRTQRFAEAVIAKPAPDSTLFPYVGWDSWCYQDRIDEQTLRREAELAASMGVELFTVDLGWARGIGDWHSERSKFPSGLRAFSDYVHSLGMKFGLHFALTEADPASPVLQQNPDWSSTEDNQYQGASSLCLSNRPTRDWLIAEGIRIIDSYNPDWIVQDGENMVKTCTKTTHTHDPLDSNYANSVQGLNAVVTAIQQARPNVYWENCENGGNMMTFNMMRNYVTSITNDASGAFAARKAVYGATYPFPPRYTDRYMPAEGMNSYVTRSYLFGGPWMIMLRLADMSVADRSFLSGEIARYKAARGHIVSGKVFHISGTPTTNAVDVLQSYNSQKDAAVAVVTRPKTAANSYLFKPKGLTGTQRYNVWFDNDAHTYLLSGTQLMNSGVAVPLPNPYSSEVVHIEKLQ